MPFLWNGCAVSSEYAFLIGVFYSQTFQELYYVADFEHDGSLPVPVVLWMDEFANGVRRFTLKTVGITDKA